MSMNLSDELNRAGVGAEKSGSGFEAYLEYSQAAKAGSVDALLNQASMYFEGVTVAQDLGRAFDLYVEAYEKGDDDQRKFAATGIKEIYEDLECPENYRVTGEFTNRTQGDGELLGRVRAFYVRNPKISPFLELKADS